MESCSFLFSGQLRLFSVTNTRLSLGINHLFLTGSLWTKSYFYFCFCLREQNHRESHTQHLPLSKILWFFQDGISFWEVTILPVCCKLSLFQEWIWVSITFIVAPTVSAIWPAWSKTCWQYLQGECGRSEHIARRGKATCGTHQRLFIHTLLCSQNQSLSFAFQQSLEGV